MNTIDFDVFYKQFSNRRIKEMSFYFTFEIVDVEHYIGYNKRKGKPFWVGFCDFPDGCAFDTPYQLVLADIFRGKSLKEWWPEIRIYDIDGLSCQDWLASLAK